jgi:antirestriction protein ArdC
MKDWLTYSEWKDLGKSVQQGEKATWFDDVPKFSKFQVADSPEDSDQPWEDCSIFDTY